MNVPSSPNFVTKLLPSVRLNVQGIFDFSDGENRKRKTKDSRSASSSHSNTDRVEGGVELANQVPSPWTDGIVSKLSAAQHTKYLEFHARELMGEPVHVSVRLFWDGTVCKRIHWHHM